LGIKYLVKMQKDAHFYKKDEITESGNPVFVPIAESVSGAYPRYLIPGESPG
jgi:hypothetical protein